MPAPSLNRTVCEERLEALPTLGSESSLAKRMGVRASSIVSDIQIVLI